MAFAFRTSHWILNSPLFRRLVVLRRRMIAASVLLLGAVYFGFLLLVGYAPDFAASPLGGGAVTVGILLALLVILFSFAITVAYVLWANRRYDPEIERLREGVQ